MPVSGGCSSPRARAAGSGWSRSRRGSSPAEVNALRSALRTQRDRASTHRVSARPLARRQRPPPRRLGPRRSDIHQR